MFKQKKSYLLLVFLVTSQQAILPTNGGATQIKVCENTTRPRTNLGKKVSLFATAISATLLTSLLYQHGQRHRANPGFSYTSEDGVNFSSEYKLNGKAVSEQKYKKALSLFYVPFHGGFLYLKSLDPFESTIRRAAPKFDSLGK